MATVEAEPQWLKSVHTHGLDHLALQIVSVTIYGDLLPGLTNVTDRIRYYSFFPWLLHRYAKDVRNTSLTKWREHLRRAEFLLALVGKVHHKDDSEGGEAIVGAEQATKALAQIRGEPRKSWKLSQWTALEHAGDEGSYFANKSGGYGQYYRGALSELGLIVFTDGDLGIGLDKESGVTIAKICDAQPGRQEFWQAVLADEISLDQIETFGGFLCPCALTNFDEECQFLTELMFGPDMGKGGTTDHRARNLRLLLSMLDQYDDVTEPVSEFRQIAYYGHSISGQKFHPPSGLEEELQRWLVYQGGEYVHFSLEQAFLAVLSLLKEASSEEAGLDRFLPSLAVKSLSVSSESLGLGESTCTWANRLLGDLFDEARAAQAPIDAWSEDPWAESTLIPDPKEQNPLEVLAHAFACVVSVLARNRVPAQTFAGFGSLDASFLERYSKNFASFRKFMFESVDREAADVYADILSNWVVGQHIRVAMRKLRHQTQTTFKVAIEDGRYIFIEDFDPTYTNPRLKQAFRFLRDLGLCGGDSHSWQIMERGKQKLRGG